MVERTTSLGLGFCLALAACNSGGGGGDTDSASTTTQPSTLSPTESPPTGESTVGGTTPDEPTGGSMSDVTETNTTPPTSTTLPPPTTGDDTTTTGDPSCDGLECQVDDCSGAPNTTTLRGTVFAPEGTLPLYNVTVYVPNAPLAPITEGVTCNLCNDGLPGDPIVATLTDTNGQFVLEGVPAGADIPLVITVGKWRRELTIPAVTACTANDVEPTLTRLPRNQSEGHIPRIALTTGSSDPFECLLRKLGIDDSEFTLPDAAGRVNLFVGANGTDRYNDANNGGADFPQAVDLWNDLERLKLYDILLMGCEGGYHLEDKSDQARANVAAFADIGGRLFLEHWHEAWIINGPGMWPNTATFSDEPDLPSPVTALINTGFPKGQALSEWMVNVGGSMQAPEMEIVQGQHTIDAVNTDLATRWVYTEDPETTVQYFTFNAPVGAPDDQQCGRVVDSDIHVSSGDQVNVPFPDGCTTTELTPQEKALIFMFFELSSCLIPDDMDPIPG